MYKGFKPGLNFKDITNIICIYELKCKRVKFFYAEVLNCYVKTPKESNRGKEIQMCFFDYLILSLIKITCDRVFLENTNT
jgi:hypothetical protein